MEGSSDDFKELEPLENLDSLNNMKSDFDLSDFTFDDISLDDADSSDKLTGEETVPEEDALAAFEVPGAVFEEENSQESKSSPEETFTEDFSSLINNDISVTDSQNDIPQNLPAGEASPAAESKAGDIPDLSAFDFADGEISLDSFISQDELDKAESQIEGAKGFGQETAPTMPASDDGEISLEDFLGDDFASFDTPAQKTEEVIADEPVLDIDLSFDDSAKDIEMEDNNDSADSIEVSSLPQTSMETEEESSSSTIGESVDLSEFGIEDEGEHQTTLPQNEEENKVTEDSKDIEMNVDVDSDSEKGSEALTEKTNEEENDSDDDDVSLALDSDSQEEFETSNQTSPNSSADDDFDVDALLSNIEDESEKKDDSTGALTEENHADESGNNFALDEAEFDAVPTEENPVEENLTGETPADESENNFALDEAEFDAVPTKENPVEENLTGETPADESGNNFALDEAEAAVPTEKTAAESDDFPSFENISLEDDSVTEESPLEEKDNAIEEDLNPLPEDENLLDEETTIDIPVISDEDAALVESSLEDFEAPSVAESDTADVDVATVEEKDAADVDVASVEESDSPVKESADDDIFIEAELEDENPALEEEAVTLEEENAASKGSALSVEEEAPAFEKGTPVIKESLSIEESPDSKESAAVIEDETTALEEEIAPVEESIVSFEEDAPSAEENTAAIEEETAPAITENLPLEEEVAPAEESLSAEEEAPVFEESAAVIEDETPALEAEAVPAEEAPSFEESTAVIEEESAPAEEDPSLALMKQISGEISSLKSEIMSLKSELSELKNTGFKEEEKTEDEKDTGFFGDSDEDDTIALSGEELSNILNTSDFVAEDASENQNDDSAPLTESDNENHQDFSVEENDASEESLSDTEKTDDENPEGQEKEELQVSSLEALAEPIDLFAEDTPAPLTDESFNYLESEVKTDEISDAPRADEDEDLEEGISDSPVEDVFAAWKSQEEEYQREQEERFEGWEEAQRKREAEGEIFSDEKENSAASEIMSFDQHEEEAEEDPDANDIALTQDELLAVTNHVHGQSPAEDFDSQENPSPEKEDKTASDTGIPSSMKEEIKSVLSYMDQLLENLPEDKIAEFAQSEQFETYKKLFTELGLS